MRKVLDLIIAFIKGFCFGAAIGYSLQFLIYLGALRAAATLAVLTFIWVYRVRIVHTIIYPFALAIRAYHWVCAPVIAVRRITSFN